MQGVEARRAANGREAVDMFEASEPGAFDFVLMDVKMPLLDGLEAAIEIRALPAAQGVGPRLRRKFASLAKPAQASYSSAR